jgi:hypothetical protein
MLKRNRMADHPSEITVSNRCARLLALHKQGLLARPADPRKDSILATMRRLRAVQLDAVNIAGRSHYTVFFSRIGPYPRHYLDELQYPGRACFEQWLHAACLVSSELYDFYGPIFRKRRRDPLRYGHRRALGTREAADYKALLKEVRSGGPLTSARIDPSSQRQKGWWKRSATRAALDLLFYEGYLAIHHRANFVPVYDLPERLSHHPPRRALTFHAAIRSATLQALSCLGVATATDIADYFRNPIVETRTALTSLIENEKVIRVSVEGWTAPAFMLAADLPLLDKADREFKASITTVLSPFDNLIWTRERVKNLFGFEYRNRMYAPSRNREAVGGYYLMPLLHCDNLIGCIDPKVDRALSTLRINSLTLRREIRPSRRMLSSVKEALAEFAAFNHCSVVAFGDAVPPPLRRSRMKLKRVDEAAHASGKERPNGKRKTRIDS